MQVKVFGMLRSVVGGHEELDVSLGEQRTVHEVLKRLVVAHPALEAKVFAAERDLSTGILVFVNGRSVHFLEGLNTRLDEGDRMTLFPAVGGG